MTANFNPTPEHVIQRVRERHDEIVAGGTEVLLPDITPEDNLRLKFHWSDVRFNSEPGSDEFKEAVLMVSMLRALEEVTKANHYLLGILGRL